MTKKRIKILVLILLTIPLFWYFKECSHRIGGFAGSYARAEFYEINSDYESVKEILKDFKTENPKFNIPLSWKDGKDSYWYFFTFYDKEQNKTFSTWIRENGPNSTTFALIGTLYLYDTTKFYRINDELDLFESYKFRKRFEELILNPVKERLRNYVKPHLELDTIVTFQSIANDSAVIRLSLLKNNTFSFYTKSIPFPTTKEQSIINASSGIWTEYRDGWARLKFIKNKPRLSRFFSMQLSGETCKLINDSVVDIMTDRNYIYILGVRLE